MEVRQKSTYDVEWSFLHLVLVGVVMLIASDQKVPQPWFGTLFTAMILSLMYWPGVWFKRQFWDQNNMHYFDWRWKVGFGVLVAAVAALIMSVVFFAGSANLHASLLEKAEVKIAESATILTVVEEVAVNRFYRFRYAKLEADCRAMQNKNKNARDNARRLCLSGAAEQAKKDARYDWKVVADAARAKREAAKKDNKK